MPAGFVMIGFAGGALSGLLGLGGGTVIIPALIYFYGMTQHQAQGTSLAMMLPPVGFLAFLEYYRNGHVELKSAFFVAAGFLIGGFIGAYGAQLMPGAVLKKVFGAFLLIVAADMILR